MELIKERINISETVCSGKTQVMSDGDVLVPEIKPDMLKILQVDAVSCITDIDVTDGKLFLSGKVNVTVLYVPDRENEKVRSAEGSFEFSHKAENGRIGAGMTAMVNCNVDRLEFSALNSRKVRIKAIVGIDYEVINVEENEIACGTGSETAQTLTKTVTLSDVSDLSRHEFSVCEKIEVPTGQESVNEIIKTDVKISDTEYKTLSGKIVVKGAVCVCVLYTDDDCNIEFTEAEIPFTEVFDAENVTEESVCDIDYSVMNVSGCVSEDSDGDRRIIEVEAEISAQVKASDSVNTEILSDCYEPFRKTELVKRTMQAEEVAERPSAQNTLREIIEFPQDAPEVTGVYNVVARPVVGKAELQGGKLLCEGRIEAYILYISDSSESPVYSMKKDFPFSYMLECSCSGSGFTPKIKAEIKHISYNLNAAGELELRCILSLNAEVMKKQTIELIDEANESDAESRGGMVIYFVQEDDSLWSIAKRYGVPQSEIVKFNELEDDCPQKGERLFIPSCGK